MRTEPKNPNRCTDSPRDKPMPERTEHANLDRPGAQGHPVARSWSAYASRSNGWRLH